MVVLLEDFGIVATDACPCATVVVVVGATVVVVEVVDVVEVAATDGANPNARIGRVNALMEESIVMYPL